MIALGDVQESLALFAEAIADEVIEFVRCDDEQDCWPWTATEPGQLQVRLPAELGKRRDFRAIVLHEVLRKSPPKPLPTERLETLFELLEDVRVAAHIRSNYPGAADDVAALHAQAGSSVPADGPTDVTAVVAALRMAAYGDAATVVGRFSATAQPLVSDVMAAAAPLREADADATTSLEVAYRIDGLFGDRAARARALTGVGPVDDDLEPPMAESPDSIGMGGEDAASFEPGELAGVGQLLDDAPEQVASGAAERELDPQAQPKRRKRRSRTASVRRSFVYDEWDYHQQSYRPAWCTVREERLGDGSTGFMADLDQRYRPLKRTIRRTLQQLRPQQLERVHRSLDGDELDLDAAIEALADRASGAPVDDRLQIRRDRAQRSVATAFLLDLSASTSSPAVPPPPPDPSAPDPFDDPMSYGPLWDAPLVTEPERRVIDIAKDAVGLMGDALAELGDAFAVYGFSGTGRNGVEFKVAIDFNDRGRSGRWSAVDAMEPLRYTRMGPAVRHATQKLVRQPQVTKQLIVISDGYPQDVDYGVDRNDRDYGVHDTADALRAATSLGVRTFCLTIDPAGHDYLRTMCRPDEYVVIDEVERLPEELANLYLTRWSR